MGFSMVAGEEHVQNEENLKVNSWIVINRFDSLIRFAEHDSHFPEVVLRALNLEAHYFPLKLNIYKFRIWSWCFTRLIICNWQSLALSCWDFWWELSTIQQEFDGFNRDFFNIIDNNLLQTAKLLKSMTRCLSVCLAIWECAEKTHNWRKSFTGCTSAVVHPTLTLTFILRKNHKHLLK